MIKIASTNYQQRGAALLLFIVFFLFASVAVSFIISRSVLSSLSEYSLLLRSKQAYASAEALVEEVATRNIMGLNVDSIENNMLFGSLVYSTTTVNAVDGLWTITSLGADNNVFRVTTVVLAEGTGASFNFGVQTGTGGISMTNSAQVIGNVFSNGPVVGSKSGGGSYVKGDVISAGPLGYVEEIHATGSMWANTIHDVVVEENASYETEDAASVVWGTRYITTANQPLADMPIPDSVVAVWQDNIETNGTIIASTSAECSSGTYVIDSDITLGNIKIDCNVEIQKNSTDVTLTGPVWVVGNLTFSQGPNIRADAGIGSRSVQMIADDPDDRETSSQIYILQATGFFGSGSPKSYILLLSMNESAETGGPNLAIDMANSANGDILAYAAHGSIEMGNGISLKEVTAYQIIMGNSAVITYESGLVNQLFTSGPGGGFTISDWSEE